MSSKIATRLTRLGKESSVPVRFAGALRPTALAVLLAALSLTAACGGGGGGEENAGTTAEGGTISFNNSTTTTAAVPAGAEFACTFETTFSDCGFGEHARVPGRATMVNVAGVNAVRLHTEPGDNNVNGSGTHERNDLILNQSRTDGFEGKEHWWAHSVLFPGDYVDPPESTLSTWNFGLVADFHDTSDAGGQASFQIMAMPRTAISPDRPTGLNFQINHGNQFSPTQHTVHIGPVVRNVWYNFVYHVKWTSGSDGYFDAWVNGVQMMAYRGPTLYAGQGVYLKLANYHTAFGQASSVVHTRVIRSHGPLDVFAGL
jgi:hypothetical protein